MVSGSLENQKKTIPIWSGILVEVLDVQLVSVPHVARSSLMVSVIVSLMDGHHPLQTVDVGVIAEGGIARPSSGEAHRLEEPPQKTIL